LRRVAVVADRVLSLRPARVEKDLRAYLSMQSADEAALAEAEERNEVLDPFWSDGGPTEWLNAQSIETIRGRYWCFEHTGVVADCPDGCPTRAVRMSGVYPSGQPVDLPEEVSLVKSRLAPAPASTDGDDPDWPCGCVTYRRDGKRRYGYMCDEHIYRCKRCGVPTFPIMEYDTACCSKCVNQSAFASGGQMKQYGPRPRISTARPQSSAPATSPDAVERTSPGVASSPDATPGHLTLARFAAADWLEERLHNAGCASGAGWVLALVDGVRELLQIVPPAPSADLTTSAIMASLINQVRCYRALFKGDTMHNQYIDELLRDADKRAEQHAEAGD